MERRLGVEGGTYKGLGYQQAVDVAGEGPVTEVWSTRSWLSAGSAFHQETVMSCAGTGLQEWRKTELVSEFFLQCGRSSINPLAAAKSQQVTDGTLIPEKFPQRIPIRG